MSRIFVGNFSFEQAWQPGLNVTAQVRRLEAELAPVWLAIAQPGDEILCPEALDDHFWKRMERFGMSAVRPVSPGDLKSSRARTLVPWGWTPAVRELVHRLKLSVNTPPQEVIWRVNSREFAYQCCVSQGCVLPGEGLAHSLSQALEQIEATRRASSGWIVKPNQGQSGRGQIRGELPPTPKEVSTIERLIERQGVVHIEPLLTAQLELSGQWEISRQGEPTFLSFTQLFTDSRGTYRGTGWNTLPLEEETASQIVRSQREVVERIQSEGYFGPVGIDAMIAVRENMRVVRAIQDVNARWTMGRIGWEWGERLRRIHSPLARSGIWSLGESAPGNNSMALSPEWLQAQPVRARMWWTPSSGDTTSVEEQHVVP